MISDGSSLAVGPRGHQAYVASITRRGVTSHAAIYSHRVVDPRAIQYDEHNYGIGSDAHHTCHIGHRYNRCVELSIDVCIWHALGRICSFRNSFSQFMNGGDVSQTLLQDFLTIYSLYTV